MITSPVVSNQMMQWNLDQNITYLNHGAFGATPVEITDEQNKWRQKLESSPLRFILRQLDEGLHNSRVALGQFIGADLSGLALVTNATHGVNTVLKSLKLTPKDEIIITNHIYPACLNALNYLKSKFGFRLTMVDLPLEGINSTMIVEQILSAIGPSTRLVMIDHITSPTALIFPVEAIVSELNKLGIESLIDGAHAPGSITLNIRAINPTYYTGNCHKWMCLPKSTGFLWVREEAMSKIVPLAISHGCVNGASFEQKFQWQGTADWSAALCIPAAIKIIDNQLEGGWEQWMLQNHNLAIKARAEITHSFNLPLEYAGHMIASMAAIPLPWKPSPLKLGSNTIDQLQEILFRDYDIEVPFFQWPDPDHLIIRISAQQYNNMMQYQYLADALCTINLSR